MSVSLARQVSSSGIESDFHALTEALDRALLAGEEYTVWFEAEDTDFVRMNRGKVRQPGSVSQRYLTLRLVRGARHAEHLLSLGGDARRDVTPVIDALSGLRDVLADVNEDPHLLLSSEPKSSRDERGGPSPPAEQVVEEILAAAEGLDLVGLYAGGPVYRGFANSLGQRNWHAVTTFNLQWSIYHRADKAVKCAYAGLAWDPDEFHRRMAQARERLWLIARPSKTLSPGSYRAYLAPAAMEEVAQLLSWGGFSGRALATKQSALVQMQAGERLDSRISLAESVESGVAPPFQPEGFIRPARVSLIEEGGLVGTLVSPRTAREFGLASTGANAWESPDSLAMAGGDLAAEDVLEALDTGLLIGNLHYLNYSDRPAARITGMTRFATFWVENGAIVAPTDVLRFDDTLYRLLGSQLEALTKQPELMLSADSYRNRSLNCVRLPGALVSEMAFTL